MKIDQKRIKSLLQHLNQQRVLLTTLADSRTKDIVQAQIMGIETSLSILGIEDTSKCKQ